MSVLSPLVLVTGAGSVTAFTPTVAGSILVPVLITTEMPDAGGINHLVSPFQHVLKH
jgi:hypothetical protein